MAKAELAIRKEGLVCPRACNTTCQIKPSRLNLTKATTSHNASSASACDKFLLGRRQWSAHRSSGMETKMRMALSFAWGSIAGSARRHPRFANVLGSVHRGTSRFAKVLGFGHCPLEGRPRVLPRIGWLANLQLYWVLCAGRHPDLRRYWVSAIVLRRVGLGPSLGLAGLQICKGIGFCAQGHVQICEGIGLRPLSSGGSA